LIIFLKYVTKQGLHKAKKILTIGRQSKGKDWAQLPPELLHLISKKMEDVSNLIHFRAVCKDWRFAADASDAPPQLPWLVGPSVIKESNEWCVSSLSSSTTQQIRFPESHESYLELAGMGFSIFFKYPAFPITIHPMAKKIRGLPEQNSTSIYRITRAGYDPNKYKVRMSTNTYWVIHELASPRKTVKIKNYGSSPNLLFIKNLSIEFPSGRVAIGFYKERLFVSLPVPKVTWIYDCTTGTKSSVVIPHPDEHVNFNFFIDVVGNLLGVMQFDVGEFLPVYEREDVWFVTGHEYIVYRLEHTDDFDHCQWSKLNMTTNGIFFWG
jgi:F-box domain